MLSKPKDHKMVRSSKIHPRNSDSRSAACYTPLFIDQQLRMFQDLYSQALWIYGMTTESMGPTSTPQDFVPPPLQRPLFLDQEEQRMQSTMNRRGPMTAPQQVMSMSQCDLFKAQVAALLHENIQLKKRLEALTGLWGGCQTPRRKIWKPRPPRAKIPSQS